MTWREVLQEPMKGSAQGAGTGALAGTFAGLILGLTQPFNPYRRLGKAVLMSGMGAVAGSLAGIFIWRILNRFPEHQNLQPIDVFLSPENWVAFQEQVVEIPETTEVVTINKQVRQVEEVVIHPVIQEQITAVQDQIRQTEIDMQRGSGSLASAVAKP